MTPLPPRWARTTRLNEPAAGLWSRKAEKSISAYCRRGRLPPPLCAARIADIASCHSAIALRSVMLGLRPATSSGWRVKGLSLRRFSHSSIAARS